ncbi:hypothetical protein [Jannaschia aquimarina]|uniref:Uncharacterized protein n=1 Tax=Jannaschia aquimarina TaxID=935700 RepID=A0A0D1EG20_9RHOB|nr:hypothetical protein [Jannaschia aquimarina]KIT16624.1 hypothetical protein jaqu_15910 [Jannaschia aquimarina]SNS94006.1 hypothetical protein SAMN05421775_103390 [Jannaschia aquimarina]
MTDATETAEEKPKPTGIRRFFGDFRTKLWAAVIALLVGGSIGYGERFVGWIGGHVQAGLRGMVEEVVTAKLIADLAESGDDAILRPAMDARIEAAVEQGGLISVAFAERTDAAIERRMDAALAEDGIYSVAMAERIDAALDARVGTAMAGELRFSSQEPTRTLRFYVPADHQVDMSLRVRDLEEGEVIRVGAGSFGGAGGGEAIIDRNGVFDVSELRQPSEGMIGVGANPLGAPSLEEEQGRMRNLLPLTLRLSHPDEVLVAASDARSARPALRSEARVEFVALLTPPLKKNHD